MLFAHILNIIFNLKLIMKKTTGNEMVFTLFRNTCNGIFMCLNIFFPLTLSLPNATTVEIESAVDSCLFLTVIRDANFCSLFQYVQGII